MSERVLTERELNRALLARQLLLQRVSLSIPRALERIGGIQNQYAPNAYIRLWSCLEGLRREQLTRALERRTVVQGTLMRTTIHTVSAREYWLYEAGLGQAARDWQLRVDRETAPAIADARRPCGRRWPTVRSLRESSRRPQSRVPLWVELVRAPPSGTWERRRADTMHSPSSGSGPCTQRKRGTRSLVRTYLRGFGPAALEDVSSWAGVP